MSRSLRLFLVLACALLLSLCGAAAADEPEVDDIVAKYVAARGGLQRLRDITSIRMTGRMTMGPGMEVPFVLEMKRPNMMRMDITIQGSRGTQAFDGTDGWLVMPFAGIVEPQAMPPDVVQQAQAQADFDGPLVDYKAKGNRVEVIGTESVDDRPACKLRVTLKDGSTRFMYLDASSWLEIKSEVTRTVRGNTIETEGLLSDYTPVEGVMFPRLMETTMGGAGEPERMQIEDIEVNVALDDARFRMPAREPQGPKAAPK